MADIYSVRASVVKSLAHPLRLQLVDLLSETEEICVCELADRVDQDQPVVSRHLGLLYRAGVVKRRRAGLQVFYRLRVPCIQRFFQCLDAVLVAAMEAQQQDLAEVVKRNE